jgi:hypothetical protein
MPAVSAEHSGMGLRIGDAIPFLQHGVWITRQPASPRLRVRRRDSPANGDDRTTSAERFLNPEERAIGIAEVGDGRIRGSRSLA